MPRKTRDQYFQECLNHFVQSKLGEDMVEHIGDQQHPLTRWTLDQAKGGREKVHVYSLSFPKEITVGQLEKKGRTEPILMQQYIPSIETISRIFQGTFGPFELWRDDKCVSSARIISAHDDEQLVKFVILVRYFKDYMPFFADTRVNRIIRDMNRAIVVQDLHINHYKSKVELLEERVEVLSFWVDELNKERTMLTTKTNSCQYERKLREMYCAAGTLEECPVCKTDIEHDALTIPPCAHFLCSSCAEQCKSCPICRGPK